MIDVPWAREAFADKPDDFLAKPSVIADVAFEIAHQDRSTWSFDVVVRPFGEPWSPAGAAQLHTAFSCDRMIARYLVR